MNTKLQTKANRAITNHAHISKVSLSHLILIFIHGSFFRDREREFESPTHTNKHEFINIFIIDNKTLKEASTYYIHKSQKKISQETDMHISYIYIYIFIYIYKGIKENKQKMQHITKSLDVLSLSDGNNNNNNDNQKYNVTYVWVCV